MKNRIIALCLILFSWAGGAPEIAAQNVKKTVKDLPLQYRRWLEEDVVYIISPKWREVFLQLESDRDREMFIEAFWKQRDPTPGTPRNEFKEEHYRRISYANQNFGRDTPGPGWRSDMGRIYIILGEPKERMAYENLYDLRPTITWFYEGMGQQFNMPNAFYVVFAKFEGSAEYRLYSPLQHGPQKLLQHYDGDQTNYGQAYYQLQQIEPQLAEVSLSLVPGETRLMNRPSMSNEILLGQRIPKAGYSKLDDSYAEKLLRFKDIVEVDYTANWIGSESVLTVVRDAAGTAFVHYAIEPNRLSFEPYEDRYHAEIEVNGKIADARNRTIYQFDRVVPVDMSREQLAAVRAKLFSFQDLFPLIPGRYKIMLLWKNRVSKEFTSLDAEVLVPEASAFSMSNPVLANKADRGSRYRGSNKAFLLNDIQLTPSPRNDYLTGETVSLFLQLQGLPADLRTGGRLVFTILKEGQTMATQVRPLTAIPDGRNVYEEFSLKDYVPANYELRVSLQGADGTERLAAQAHFYVSPRIQIPRPWVLSLPAGSPSDPSVANIIGNQYLQSGSPEKARPLLEAAYSRSPGSAAFAMDYCKVLIAANDYLAVKGIIAPFLAGERRNEFLQIAGQTSEALGEYAAAAAFYKDYLTRFGTNIPVLNAVGSCYVRLNNIPEALVAWEKSLQLNPNQPELREKVKALKEKK